jgi:uncharacterized protein YggE
MPGERLMKRAIVLLVLITVGCALAQNPPTITAQANTVFTSAEGRFESPPDTALVQFNISAQEETSKAAYQRAADAAEQVRQILRTNGLDPKAAEIGFFSIAPVYDWRQPKRKLVGYRVNTNVSLKLKDFTKVAPIVQALGDQDYAENVSLNYTLDDMDAAKLKAVEDAFQRARDEAATVAKAGGRTLGELSYASVDTFEQVHPPGPPVPMRAQAMRAEAAPPTAEFTPQKITVTARVNAMCGLK